MDDPAGRDGIRVAAKDLGGDHFADLVVAIPAAAGWSGANAVRDSAESCGPGSIRKCRFPVTSVQMARARPD